MRYILFISKKQIKTLFFIFVSIVIVFFAALPEYKYVLSYISGEAEIKSTLEDYFRERGNSLISGDTSYIEGQFDTTSQYGKWSYEHELMRIKYVKDWSAARGTRLLECEPKLKILSIRQGKGSVRIYLSVRTRFTYIYNDKPDIINEFCLGTKHTITMLNKNDIWYITVDWYSDPLEDTSVAGTFVPVDNNDEVETYAYAKTKYNRAKAVEYADRYCGALWDREDGYKYNQKYRNYADLGGDCANFASQVLSDKSAGNLRMGGGWLYTRGTASKAWVNAGSFTMSMLYSGRARLVSKGNYNKVVKFINQIYPGDIIAYEKKGDIVHVSVVTARDSNGSPLVNSHTNDRYHVPWDLGWGSNNINFWLLRVND